MPTPTMSKLDRYKVAARMWWALVVKPKLKETKEKWMSSR